MKTLELAQVQRDFADICQGIARAGQTIVVTQEHEPLVAIGPVADVVGSGEETVWERRRQFEQRHGALTEDFVLPLRHLDEARWEDPVQD